MGIFRLGIKFEIMIGILMTLSNEGRETDEMFASLTNFEWLFFEF